MGNSDSRELIQCCISLYYEFVYCEALSGHQKCNVADGLADLAGSSSEPYDFLLCRLKQLCTTFYLSAFRLADQVECFTDYSSVTDKSTSLSVRKITIEY